MKDVDLLGIHPDGTQLILNDADGERYTLAITQDLRDLLGAYQPFINPVRTTASGNLQPSEIQSLIRSGMSSEQIAKQHNMPTDQITKYERPILDERHYFAQRAQQCRIGSESDSPTLGDLVVDRLAARGVDTTRLRWDATRHGKNPWQIRLTFIQGAQELTANWQMDQHCKAVVALDEEAIWLSETRRPGQINNDYLAEDNPSTFQDLADLAPGMAGVNPNGASQPTVINSDNVRSFTQAKAGLAEFQEDPSDATVALEIVEDSDSKSWNRSDPTQVLLDYLDQARGQRGRSLPEGVLEEEDELDYARLAELAQKYDLGDLEGLSHAELADLLAQDQAGTLGEEQKSDAITGCKSPTEGLAGKLESTKGKIISFTNALLGVPEGDPEEIVQAAVTEVIGETAVDKDSLADVFLAETIADNESDQPADSPSTGTDADADIHEELEVSDDLKLAEVADPESINEKPESLDNGAVESVEESTNELTALEESTNKLAMAEESAEDPVTETEQPVKATAETAGSELTDKKAAPEPRAEKREDDRQETAREQSNVGSETADATALPPTWEVPQISPDEAADLGISLDDAEANLETTAISQVKSDRVSNVLPGMEKMPGPVVPLGAKEPVEPEDNPDTQQVPLVDENQLILPPPSKRKKKGKRQSVPSWDEIVFGAKPR